MSRKRPQTNLALKEILISSKGVSPSQEEVYEAFDQLNGDHPWRDFVPEGYIDYSARILSEGRVTYFNFALAKEMGLISPEHSHELNPELKKKLVATFSLRIINEYDQSQKIRYSRKKTKDRQYMATRYLQLQHSNKLGKTSGDGRCIWNGTIQHLGKVWDVSSRGVGVTALAPGVIEAGKPLESGAAKYGYGCGMAELDELYGAAISAEIFHRHGLVTERMLAIIDLGNGNGIGVRAGQNLLRPAHIFLYLKQNNLSALRRAVDYFIVRQHRNGDWQFGIHHPQRYRLMLRHLVAHFAHFLALLDRHYIFTWLDWDGDNVLASAGIIDYGSVRQFGIRHDQYRYDDVQRYSTNLNQQIPKARQIMQTFAQIVDYLETSKKKPLTHFARDPSLKEFSRLVQKHLHLEFLNQLGFCPKDSYILLKTRRKKIEKIFRVFTTLERKKVKRSVQKVADGVNRPAAYNMKKAIYDLAQFFCDHCENLTDARYPLNELFHSMLSEYSGPKDAKLTPSTRRHLSEFQDHYRQLITLVTKASQQESRIITQEIFQRASIKNREDRMTGNALIHIVSEIMDARRRGLSDLETQKVIDSFIEQQSPISNDSLPKNTLSVGKRGEKLMATLMTLLEGHKEDI